MNIQRIILDGARKSIRLVANVYTPKSRPSQITAGSGKSLVLFFAHANGYHKELWEPIISRIFESQDRSWRVVKAISLDSQNHGDSSELNQGHLATDVFQWSENAQDILQVVDQLNLKNTSEMLVAVGHSFGASSLILAELSRPGTFQYIAAVDPTIPDQNMQKHRQQLVEMARRRKNGWATRQDAKAYFLSKPLFAAWDEAVLDLHVEHGLRIIPEEDKFVLKCDPSSEAAVFAGGSYVNIAILPNLGKVLSRVYLVIGKMSHVCPPSHAARICAMLKNSNLYAIPDAGHLVVMERPSETAREITRFLDEITSNSNDRATAHIIPSQL